MILSWGVATAPLAIYKYQLELWLSATEVWFIQYILSFKWTSWFPYPSLKKMAKTSWTSPTSLHKYKNSLIQKWYLEVINRIDKQSWGQTSNAYNFWGLFWKLEILIKNDKIWKETNTDNVIDWFSNTVNTPVSKMWIGWDTSIQNMNTPLSNINTEGVKNLNTNKKEINKKNIKKESSTNDDEIFNNLSNKIIWINLKVVKKILNNKSKIEKKFLIKLWIEKTLKKLNDWESTNACWYFISLIQDNNFWKVEIITSQKKINNNKKEIEESKKLEIEEKRIEEEKRKINNFIKNYPDFYQDIFDREYSKLEKNWIVWNRLQIESKINARIIIKKEYL